MRRSKEKVTKSITRIPKEVLVQDIVPLSLPLSLSFSKLNWLVRTRLDIYPKNRGGELFFFPFSFGIRTTKKDRLVQFSSCFPACRECCQPACILSVDARQSRVSNFPFKNWGEEEERRRRTVFVAVLVFFLFRKYAENWKDNIAAAASVVTS